MTSVQKDIINALFDGGIIAHNGEGEIRLRDKNFNPVRKINAKTFYQVKSLLRKNKRNLYVYSLAAIRALHGSSWVKREYKRRRKAKTLLKGK